MRGRADRKRRPKWACREVGGGSVRGPERQRCPKKPCRRVGRRGTGGAAYHRHPKPRGYIGTATGFRQDRRAPGDRGVSHRSGQGPLRPVLDVTRNVGFLGYQSIDATSTVIRVVPLATGNDALGVLDGGRLVRLDLETGAVIQTLDTLLPSLPTDSVPRPCCG